MSDRTFWIFFWSCVVCTMTGAGILLMGDREWGALLTGIGSGIGICIAYFIVIKIISEWKEGLDT